jgi:hypothetical protein
MQLASDLPVYISISKTTKSQLEDSIKDRPDCCIDSIGRNLS